MSGYGGYNVNFLTFGTTSANLKEKTSIKIIVNGRVGGYIYYIHPKTEVPSFKIKISGLVTDYAYVDENNIRQVIRIKEGEHILPKSYASDTITTLCGFMNPITSESTENGIIELLPEYPDALVFDGVDDYGVCVIPNFKDFTFISKRMFFSDNGIMKAYFDFIKSGTNTNRNRIDLRNQSQDMQVIYNKIITNANFTLIDKEPKIRYVTPISDNGKIIQGGAVEDNIDDYNLKLGDKNDMAFYSAYLFDRSLDEQEIKSFIRKHIDPEYLLPSEIPTPDVYYDFTNGDNSKGEANNVIKDLSGNGNDATAHNFAWNEESGYAEGRLKFDGVDDYVSLDTFDSVFKTMFMVCTNFEAPAGSILYDQRSELFNKNYSVAYYPSSIAYNNDNINGTYINGTLNTKLACQELNNKKHLIHVVAKDTSESRKPNIGRSLGQNQYSNMMLYKFLGFKEALTEEQIKAVINKYNLLDGVDNIN